jgi:hypothetical protein
MNIKIKLILVTTMFCFLPGISFGQDNWNSEQKHVIETISGLSETTAVDGKGADAYSRYLSVGFNRWTIGSTIINNKNTWVEGVREWFDDGWRVSDRKQQVLEILIMKDFAQTRRIVTETYIGPTGDTSISKAALVEIWIKENNKWLLYRVNVHPMAND